MKIEIYFYFIVLMVDVLDVLVYRGLVHFPFSPRGGISARIPLPLSELLIISALQLLLLLQSDIFSESDIWKLLKHCIFDAINSLQIQYNTK